MHACCMHCDFHNVCVLIFISLQEVLRRDWMFKLVGKETFCVGGSDTKATINIDAVSGFAYEYTLEINGKSLKKYMENRSKVTSTWVLSLDGTDCRVVLGERRGMLCPLLMSNTHIGFFLWKLFHILPPTGSFIIFHLTVRIYNCLLQ